MIQNQGGKISKANQFATPSAFNTKATIKFTLDDGKQHVVTIRTLKPTEARLVTNACQNLSRRMPEFGPALGRVKQFEISALVVFLCTPALQERQPDLARRAFAVSARSAIAGWMLAEYGREWIERVFEEVGRLEDNTLKRWADGFFQHQKTPNN